MRRTTVWLAVIFAILCGVQSARADSNYADVSAKLNSTALQPGHTAVLAVVFEVREGFHAQSHASDSVPFTVTLDPVSGVTAGVPIYPPGKVETSALLGTLNVYVGKTIIYVPLTVKSGTSAGAIKLGGSVNYQACDEKMCFAPVDAPFSLETKIAAESDAVSPANAATFAGYDSNALPVETTTSVAASLNIDEGAPNWPILTALGIAFLAGIFFNVMPCVLPVLPLKAIGFYEVSQHHRGKTMLLAGFFSVGIIAVFAVLAVLILITKNLTWGEQFSNPIFAWGIVILLLVMALAMFGAFTFSLPTSVYAFTPRHDTYTGNFLFGILTALLSTPCTAPLFPPLLLWAKAQPVSVGVPAVMMVGVGMAFPYLLLSAFPEMARRFPRVGPWAELVKQMMGFLLLGAAVFFAAGQLLHGPALWWPTVGVACVAALYLMGRSVQFSKNGTPVAVASVLAVAMVAVPTYIAIFMSFGGATWTPYSDQALAQARSEHKIALVKFTANWCLNCQTVEATVYHDEAALRALRNQDVVMLKADLTRKDALGWPLLKKLNATGGIPLTAIYPVDTPDPVQLSSVYTTTTLLKVLDSLKNVHAVSAR